MRRERNDQGMRIAMILGIVLFLGSLLSDLHQGPYGYQAYAYSAYGYGSARTFSPANQYRMSGAGNYVGGYGNQGYSPYLMPSTSCNTLLGCRQNYDSHIYIRNALDYTYYTHPELLAPRYMDNHQRQASGLWPQRFYY